MTAQPATALHNLPVKVLKGVGPRVTERLSRLGIHTVQDLLFHLPSRYQDRTRVTPIGSLQPGQEVVVVGRVESSRITYGRRRSLLILISDHTGGLTIRMFHFGNAQQQSLVPGTRVLCFGEVRRGPSSLEMVHPETRYLPEDEAPVQVDERLTPIYPTTEGLHQISLRKLTDGALELLQQHPGTDLIPAAAWKGRDAPSLGEALHYVHRPPPDARLEQLLEGRHPAQQRLAFEELLAHHLSLRARHQRRRALKAPGMPPAGKLTGAFVTGLSFALTGAQQRVCAAIEQDLAQPHPMQRLLQGDVGSGKTVVAALAALQAVENGHQAALMAPTELLAEQHYRNFLHWFSGLDVPVIWLSGKLATRERRAALEALASASPLLAIGTHALFQEEVQFSSLGLAIIDEQHRFGVHQRLALRRKAGRSDHLPHQLIMTATPIPRTLAMTAYADLDTSIIDELPPGRQPVDTVAVPEDRRDEIIQRIRAACGAGRQAYWVCTLIDESEALQARAASDTAVILGDALPELKVGLVHGRMKPAERDAVMSSFKRGDVHLLVATTVIEVGVDVPRASLMLVENAERLGLSQLHQLRGRVGRGTEKSSCVLMYRGPLSKLARARLEVMRETGDGFVIAQRDLELRGPGELLGTRQTGSLQLRIADLIRDRYLFSHLEETARHIIEHHPRSVDALVRRWIGDGVQYRDV